MARRKKGSKRGEQASPKAAEQTFSNTPLAALASLRAARDGKGAVKAPKPLPKPVVPAPPVPVRRGHDDGVDDETLFREAVAGIASGVVYDGKYGGGGAGIVFPDDNARDERSGEGEIASAASGDGSESRPMLSDDERSLMEFERVMMGMGLERPEEPRTVRRVSMAPKERAAVAAAASVAPPPRVAKKAPQRVRGQESVHLNGGERRVLEQVRRAERAGDEVPTVTLRGEGLRTALARVDAFLGQQARDGARYARIITGKGKKSPQEPVIKREVAKILADHGAVVIAAPEVGRDGDFGAYIVQLRRPR